MSQNDSGGGTHDDGEGAVGRGDAADEGSVRLVDPDDLRLLIRILEGVAGYPRLFRNDCEAAAGHFIEGLVEHHLLSDGVRGGNPWAEGTSPSWTNVRNVVTMLKKGLIEKCVVHSDFEYMERAIGDFYEELEDWAHIRLADNDRDEYFGLDSARDTEEEARNLIRAFPNILSRDVNGNFPIHNLLCLAGPSGGNGTRLYQTNLKAISFVPLFAQQAIEWESFEPKYRGGLLVKMRGYNAIDFGDSPTNIDSLNVLQLLAGSDGQDKPGQATERNKQVDIRLLKVLQRLASMGLLTKADVRKQNLLTTLCYERYFAAERFRFLSEWDPRALTAGDRDGDLPLHLVAHDLDRGFPAVLAAGVDRLPDGEGLCLPFRKRKDGETTFGMACERHGSPDAIAAIESVLFRRDGARAAGAADALLRAATERSVSLDGVYFLLRRIGVAHIALSPSTAARDGAEGKGDEDRVVATPTRILRSSKKKRSTPAVRRSNRKRNRL